MKKLIFLFFVFAVTTLGAQTPWGGTAVIWEKGAGTELDPYQIESGEHLAYLATSINDGTSTYADVYFELTANIDLSLLSWTPIGSSKANSFKGIFDGNGMEIDKLSTDVAVSKMGLFCYNYGVIKNLGIGANSEIKGAGTVAAIVVFNEGTILNCYNSGTITSTQNAAAGIAAYNGYAGNDPNITPKIIGCYNTGTINGVGTIGGISSNSYDPKNIVSNCYNIGNMNGPEGGSVAGIMSAGASIVRNCYNKGAIVGMTTVGGIVGKNINNDNAIIENCYNLGTVKATFGFTKATGSIIGTNSVKGVIRNCYTLDNLVTAKDYDTDIIVTGNGNGTGEIKTSEEMKTRDFVLTLNAEQMPEEWYMDIDIKNDGYPALTPSMILVTINVIGEGTLEITNNGKIINNGEKAMGGTTLMIKATPDEDNRLVEIKVDGEPFTADRVVILNPMTFEATFEEIPGAVVRHVVTIETPVNGTLEVKNGTIVVPDGGKVEEGTSLSIIATPNENYVLTNISVDGDPIEGTIVTVTNPITIAAKFDLKKYAVEWTNPKGATIVVKDGETDIVNGAKISHGTVLTISLVTDAGYTLNTLTVNDVDFESGTAYTVTGAVTIAATTTVNSYVITWTNPKGAVISVKHGENTLRTGMEVDHGETITISAAPSTGYTIGDTKVNGTVISGTNHIVVGVTNIEVLTIINEYKVNVMPAVNGTLTVKNGEVSLTGETSVEHGVVLSISAQADENYELIGITVNEAPMTGTEIRVTKDMKIEATFGPKSSVENINALGLSFYPNPVRDILSVSGEYESLEIYNSNGQLVMTANGEVKLDLSCLTTGVYIVKAFNNGRAGTYKIVK